MSKYLSREQLRKIIDTFNLEEQGHLTTSQVAQIFQSSISRINRLALWSLKSAPTLNSVDRFGQNGKYRLFNIEDVISYYTDNTHLFSPKLVKDSEMKTVYIENEWAQPTDTSDLNSKIDMLWSLIKEISSKEWSSWSSTDKDELIKSLLEKMPTENKKDLQDNLEIISQEEPQSNKNTSKSKRVGEASEYLEDFIQHLKEELTKKDDLIKGKELIADDIRKEKDGEITRLHNESKWILAHMHTLQGRHKLLKNNVKLLIEWKIQNKDIVETLKKDSEENAEAEEMQWVSYTIDPEELAKLEKEAKKRDQEWQETTIKAKSTQSLIKQLIFWFIASGLPSIALIYYILVYYGIINI